MPFTYKTLTTSIPGGEYLDLELVTTLTNGAQIEAEFSERIPFVDGVASRSVAANDDAGTAPAGTYYLVSIKSAGGLRSFPLVVQAAAGATINLDTAVPSTVGTPAVAGVPGPKGDTGAAGTNGTNGINGTNGTDGAVTLNRHFQSRALSALSVAHATFVDIPLASSVESSLGAGTWNGVLATLGESGLYLLSWGIKWADNTAGGRVGLILSSSDGSLAGMEVTSGTAGFSTINGSTVRRLSSGSTLKLRGFQSSGAALDIIGDSRTYMSVTPLF